MESINMSTCEMKIGEVYKVNLPLLYETYINPYIKRELGYKENEEVLYKINFIYDFCGHSNGRRVAENGEEIDSTDINLVYLYQGELTEEKEKLMRENVKLFLSLKKKNSIFSTNKLSKDIVVTDEDEEEVEIDLADKLIIQEEVDKEEKKLDKELDKIDKAQVVGNLNNSVLF